MNHRGISVLLRKMLVMLAGILGILAIVLAVMVFLIGSGFNFATSALKNVDALFSAHRLAVTDVEELEGYHVHNLMPTRDRAHASAIRAMLAMPDGSGFFTGGADGYIRSWTWNGDLAIQVPVLGTAVDGLAIKPNGTGPEQVLIALISQRLVSDGTFSDLTARFEEELADVQEDGVEPVQDTVGDTVEAPVLVDDTVPLSSAQAYLSGSGEREDFVGYSLPELRPISYSENSRLQNSASAISQQRVHDIEDGFVNVAARRDGTLFVNGQIDRGLSIISLEDFDSGGANDNLLNLGFAPMMLQRLSAHPTNGLAAVTPSGHVLLWEEFNDRGGDKALRFVTGLGDSTPRETRLPVEIDPSDLAIEQVLSDPVYNLKFGWDGGPDVPEVLMVNTDAPFSVQDGPGEVTIINAALGEDGLQDLEPLTWDRFVGLNAEGAIIDVRASEPGATVKTLPPQLFPESSIPGFTDIEVGLDGAIYGVQQQSGPDGFVWRIDQDGQATAIPSTIGASGASQMAVSEMDGTKAIIFSPEKGRSAVGILDQEINEIARTSGDGFENIAALSRDRFALVQNDGLVDFNLSAGTTPEERARRTLNLTPGARRTLAVSPRNDMLAVMEDIGVLRLIRLEDFVEVARMEVFSGAGTPERYAVDFSPRGEVLALGSPDGLSFIDIGQILQKVATVESPELPGSSVCLGCVFSEFVIVDEAPAQFVTIDATGALRRWNVTTGEQQGEALDLPNIPVRVRLTDPGVSSQALVAYPDGSVELRDLLPNAAPAQRVENLGSTAMSMIKHPNENKIAIGTTAGTVHVIDLDRLNRLSRWDFGHRLHKYFWSVTSTIPKSGGFSSRSF